MQRTRIYLLWLWLGLTCCQVLSAQNLPNGDDMLTQPDSISSRNDQQTLRPFVVRNIIIEGNRVTKPKIILREIPFKSGDVVLLQDLVLQFEKARRQLMNTALFHEAIVALKSFEGYNIDVVVQVKERWYIFPVPYFKPVDRNLNQWLVEQKASLNRVNYGGKLLYNNVTGRNDKLRLWVISGYTRQFSFSYDRLYIDKKMKWGMNVVFATGKNREMNYISEKDKQVFLKDENYVRSFTFASAELTYRKAIKTRHRFGVGFTREKIADTIAAINPNYFGEGIKKVSFPELYYMMTFYDVDYIPYPSKGYAAEISVKKKGFTSDFNLLQLTTKGAAYWPTGKRSFFSLNGYAALKLPFKQPYFNQKLLGYEDAYMQGYEYYVVDGVAAGYLKAAFTRKIINFNIRIPGTKKIAPQRIPFNIYARVFGNTGYVHHPEPGSNTLSNKMLFTGGFGIDITTIYDFALKLDWSFNQLGQNGIFIHKRSVF